MIRVQQQTGRIYRFTPQVPADGNISKLLVRNSPDYISQVSRIFVDKGTIQNIDELLSFTMEFPRMSLDMYVPKVIDLIFLIIYCH